MNLPISVDQQQLMDVLLNVAKVRPVFIWGAPGIWFCVRCFFRDNHITPFLWQAVWLYPHL